MIQHGRAELMQPCECEFQLRLNADGALYPAAWRVLAQVLEQRRLAYPGLAPYDQCPALTSYDFSDELIELPARSVAADQFERIGRRQRLRGHA
jgi:hypothetical protein